MPGRDTYKVYIIRSVGEESLPTDIFFRLIDGGEGPPLGKKDTIIKFRSDKNYPYYITIKIDLKAPIELGKYKL